MRWKRAVEVGGVGGGDDGDGGEEKRLGGSCGESFLNEGSKRYRAALHGSCSAARITKRKAK